MTRTVDLVIVGMSDAGAAAAIDAVERGQRVLVVGESKDARFWRRLRRAAEAAGDNCRERLSLLAGFEVVFVDGIGAVEVVLVRNVRTGGLIGINTGAILATTARTRSRRCHGALKSRVSVCSLVLTLAWPSDQRGCYCVHRVRNYGN